MNTKTLRQKILDLAIHGKLVAQDPDDEPASELLKRIKAEKEEQIKEGKIKKSKKTKTTSDTPKSENPPFEIPSSWEWTTLGEISSFLSRGKSPKYSEENKQYPVFAQKCNLKDGGISLEYARFLDPSTICKWDDEYKLKTGDVLVNSTGTGTVGRTRLFDERYLGDYPFVVPDSHVSVVRTMKEIESEFVCIYISSQCIQQYLEDNLAGSTNQKELYIGILCDLHFPLPPLAEQKRIVAEIERWFALIDQIEQSKAALQATIAQAKKKILDLAIHGKLVAQDPDDEPASELLKRIKAEKEQQIKEGKIKKSKKTKTTSVPFEIPSSWEWTTLGEISNYGCCENIPVAEIGENDWVLELEDIEKDTARIAQIRLKQDRDIKGVRHKFTNGDVLYSKLRTYLNKVLVAPHNGYCTTEIVPLHSYCNVSTYYLSHVLRSGYFLDYTQQCGYGVKMPRLSTNDACNGSIPLPPLAEQKRIVKKIEELFGVLDTIQQALGE